MSTPQSIPPVPFTAKALYNFVGNHEDELQFKKGDYVTVLQVVEGGWWEGQLQVPGAAQGTGPIGWFPANHIKIIAALDVQPQQITTPQENGAIKDFPPQSKNEGSKSSQKVSHYSLGVYSLLESQLKFEEVLNNLLEKSLIPLGNNNILSAKDYDILCCNLHEITQLVKSLTKELTDVCKQPPNQQKIGKQFSNFLSRYRNLLLVYCANHPSAVRVISNHSAQLDNFAKASRSSSGGTSAGASNAGSSSSFSGTILDLTAAFSLPFRQIETYSSILRDIRASITENHLDFQHITDAIRMAENLVSELEEIRNMKEKELEILAARIESWPLNVGAASAGEPQLSPMGPVLLLVSVWFQKNNNQGLLDCYMVMFSDYLVILETTYDPMCYRCQHVIEMHDLVAHAKDVTAPPDQIQLQIPHTSLPLTLIDREGERYQVFFKSNQSRSLWVKSIGEQSALATAAPLGTLTSQAMGGSSMANAPGLGSSASSKQFSNQQNRNRAATTSAAISSTGVPTPSQSLAASGSSRNAAPFMRSDRNTPLSSSGRSTTAVISGGFDITQLRPNPPMTPSELILCSRHSADSVKSPKVSRKKSNRKSDVFCMALSPLAYSATQYGDSYPYAVRPAAATTNVTDPVVTSRPFYARGQAPWPPGGPGGGASQIDRSSARTGRNCPIELSKCSSCFAGRNAEEKIRAEEFAEIQNRKTLDCRSLDHDAKIFEVIEAYCQSSQNRMTLHSVNDVREDLLDDDKLKRMESNSNCSSLSNRNSNTSTRAPKFLCNSFPCVYPAMLQCCTTTLISTAHKKVIHPTQKRPKPTDPSVSSSSKPKTLASRSVSSSHHFYRSGHSSWSAKEKRAFEKELVENAEKNLMFSKPEFKHMKKGTRAVSQLNLYTHGVSNRSWHGSCERSNTLGPNSNMDTLDDVKGRRSDDVRTGHLLTSGQSRSSISYGCPKMLSTPSLNSVYRSFPALFSAATAITLPYSNIAANYSNSNSFSPRAFTNACSNETYQMLNQSCL